MQFPHAPGLIPHCLWISRQRFRQVSKLQSAFFLNSPRRFGSPRPPFLSLFWFIPRSGMPGSALHTLVPVNVQTKAVASTILRRDADYRRGQTFRKSVCKSKVFKCSLRIQRRTSFGEAKCLLSLQSVWIFRSHSVSEELLALPGYQDESWYVYVVHVTTPHYPMDKEGVPKYNQNGNSLQKKM